MEPATLVPMTIDSGASDSVARKRSPEVSTAAAGPLHERRGKDRDRNSSRKKRRRSRSQSSGSSGSGSGSSSSPERRVRKHSKKHKLSKDERQRERSSKGHKHGKESSRKERRRKGQKEKEHKHGERKSSPVQLSKYMHEDVARSAISGKKIKMKVEKSKEDKIAEQRRQKLLAFLNSSVE